MDFPVALEQVDSLHLLKLLQAAIAPGWPSLPWSENAPAKRLSASVPRAACLAAAACLICQGALARNKIVVIIAPQKHHLVRSVYGKNPGCQLVQKSAIVRC